jgi:electron-transferring-flavoprotein dehydrogenase
LLPDCFRNEGNYVVSLGNVVRWLAAQAEALGVEIFPGFPAAEVLYGEGGARARRRDGQPRHRQER